MAKLLDRLYDLASGQKERAYPELGAIASGLERVNDILEKSLKTGVVTPAQERSMARQFRAIAGTLDAGAKRAGAPKRRTSR
jgi:hypothetical protein